jgi:hypothetical protein
VCEHVIVQRSDTGYTLWQGGEGQTGSIAAIGMTQWNVIDFISYIGFLKLAYEESFL